MNIEKEEGEDITELLMSNIYTKKEIENITNIKEYKSKNYFEQDKFYKDIFNKKIHKEIIFHKKKIHCMDWLENNSSSIFVTGSSDTSIKVWDLNIILNSSNKDTSALLTINSHNETINNICSRNNNHNQFLSSSIDKHIKFWDIRGNLSNINNKLNICKPSYDKLVRDEIKHLQFNNNGNQFAFINKEGTILYLFDLRKFEEIHQINFKQSIYDFSFDKSDKKIFAASEDGNVYLINLDDIDNRQIIQGSLFPLYSIDIDKENKNFITGGIDGILVSYDMDELMSSKTFKKSDQCIKQVMYNYNDKLIACIYDGKNIDFFSTEMEDYISTIYTNNLIYFMKWNKKRNILGYVSDDKKTEDWKNKNKEEGRSNAEGSVHFFILPDF